jgi:transcriptional regulator with XRE-family HTH domain
VFAVFSSYIAVMLCENAAMTTQTPIQQVPAVREHFARRLKELRIPRGFPTARSLSRALGIDENRYTRYERAEVEPDLSLLLKICGLLRASPNDLLLTPSGYDEAPSSYQSEPARATLKPIAGKSSSGAAANLTTQTGGQASDPQRRRAIAWQLATETTDAADAADGSAPSGAMARMQRISHLFNEIDADPFVAIGRLSDDHRLKSAAAADVAKIAARVEELIAAIASDGS